MSGGDDRWRRIEGVLVKLIAIHSFAVGLALLFVTRWGLEFGGWTEVSPLFFPRQAGVFHLVVATGYLIEYRRHGSVCLLLLAKCAAVLFLAVAILAGGAPWAVPLSAVVDGAMALAVWFVHRRAAGS